MDVLKPAQTLETTPPLSGVLKGDQDLQEAADGIARHFRQFVNGEESAFCRYFSVPGNEVLHNLFAKEVGILPTDALNPGSVDELGWEGENRGLKRTVVTDTGGRIAGVFYEPQ